jgi:hypothetical protein
LMAFLGTGEEGSDELLRLDSPSCLILYYY